MIWREKDEAEKVADLAVIREIVSGSEIQSMSRVHGFRRILAMAGIDSVDPTSLNDFSDDEWMDVFGEHAFEVAVALQAIWVEEVCEPMHMLSCSVEELQPLLWAHRRVRRLAPP